MRTLERACAFGATDGIGPSRQEQLCAAVLLLRRFTRIVLALSLIGIVFSGVLAYRDLAAVAVSSAATVWVGEQPPSVYSLLAHLLIAGLSAFSLARTRLEIGDEIMG